MDDEQAATAPQLPTQMHTVVIPPANHTSHQWRQRGFVVHCDSCDPGHGFNLRHDQQLTGINANGYPVIETISVSAPVSIIE